MPRNFSLFVSKDHKTADRPFKFGVDNRVEAVRVEARVRQHGADRDATFVITPINVETDLGTLSSDPSTFVFENPPTLDVDRPYWIDVTLDEEASADIAIMGAIYFDSDPASVTEFELDGLDNLNEVYARTELLTEEIPIADQ